MMPFTTLLYVEQSRVQLIFCREMFENGRLRNAGRAGNVLCGRSTETTLGKKVERGFKDHLSATVAGHPRGVVTGEKFVIFFTFHVVK